MSSDREKNGTLEGQAIRHAGISSPRSAVRAGAIAIAPVLLGVLPFATIAGIAAASVGLPKPAGLALSALVYAGASQLAALELIARNAPIAAIVLTAGIINLRFVMYSASIAPHFQHLARPWRLLLAYILTDQAYAISLAHFESRQPPHKHWFFLGGALLMWVTWQLGTAAGLFLGAQVPASWQLEFAIPLTCLAVAVPALRDRANIVAASVGGGVAVVANGLPFNLGLIVGALSGIAAGVWWESRRGGGA